jgi:hypothetical protein
MIRSGRRSMPHLKEYRLNRGVVGFDTSGALARPSGRAHKEKCETEPSLTVGLMPRTRATHNSETTLERVLQNHFSLRAGVNLECDC